VVVAFLLAATVAAPLYGYVGDRFGRRRALLGALAVFTVASCACSLAPSFWWLVGFRALQGLGGGGLMTLAPNGTGGDSNTLLAENSGLAGNGLVVPQFSVSTHVFSWSGGVGNAYNNVGVGVIKDANNFILAGWSKVDNHAFVQVKIGGANGFHGNVSFNPTAPFDLGLSLVTSSLVVWYSTDGGLSWTALTSYQLSEIDMRSEVLANGALWRPCISLATENAVAATLRISRIRFGSFGTVGIRDICPEYAADGTPVVSESGDVRGIATFMDPTGAAHLAGVLFSLATREITMTSCSYVNRNALGGTGPSPGLYPDDAGQLVQDGASGWHMFLSSWGNANTTADAINILYKHITSGDPFTGVNVIAAVTKLALPGIPESGGCYDPSCAFDDGLWRLSYTIGPNAVSAYYPALATSPDLATWTLVDEHSTVKPYEGSRVIRMAGELWSLWGSLANYNVYNQALELQGSITCAIQPEAGTAYPPHPTMIPWGQYVYNWTFNNTEFGGQDGTQGQMKLFRSPRYL